MLMKQLFLAIVIILSQVSTMYCADNSISRNLDQLRSDDETISKAATEVLVEMGVDAVPALIEALDDPDPLLREGAANILGRIGKDSEPAIPKLIEGLDSPDPMIRLQYAWALGKIGLQPQTVVPALEHSLKNKRPTVRAYAIDALSAYLDVPGVMDSILGLYNDEDSGVRWWAASVTTLMGPQVIEPLIALSEDTNPIVRKTTCWAFSGMAHHRYIPTNWLRDMALDESIETGNLYSISGSVSVGLTGSASVTPDMLKAILPALAKLVLDSALEVRNAALTALNDFPVDISEALPPLFAALETGDGDLRRRAIRVLSAVTDDPKLIDAIVADLRGGDFHEKLITMEGIKGAKIHAPVLIDALQELIHSDQLALRIKAIQTLAEIGITDSKMLQVLLDDLASNQDSNMRWIMIRSLGYFKQDSPEVTAILLDALKDGSNSIRAAAAESLGNREQDAELVISALIESLNDESNFVSFQASYALSQFGNKAVDAIPQLEKLVQRQDIRSVDALYALYKIGSKPDERLSGLLKFISEKDKGLSGQAAIDIAIIGPDAAVLVPDLAELLRTSDKSITRLNVLIALKGIGPTAKSVLPQLYQMRDEGPSMLEYQNILEAIKAIEGEPEV